VSNQADSVNDQLAVAPADNRVIAKPQVVNTTTKTRKDIIKYVTQSGDTVSSLAAKFGVTSDSIKWSNGLTADNLAAGKQLWISPISDGIVYTVVSGDTAQSLADKYRTSKDAIVAFNDAEVGGLPVGEKIVIPGGTQPARASSVGGAAAYGGFAWGGYQAVYSSNGYDFGWCTYYAALRRAQMGRPVPSNLGNAYSWYRLAQRAGIPTGLAPQVGAVAVNEGGNHVSVVEVVNEDGSFWVSEMNSRGQVSMTDPTPTGGWNRIDWKLYGSAGNLKFVY
jgi:surface antigen